MDKNTLIQDIATQQDYAKQIREIQKKEREIRSEILKELFGENNIGSLKSQVSNLMVTGNYGLTYKFSQEELDDAIENGFLSEEAMNAIKVEYKLDKKAYDALSKEACDELDEYLVVKPSLPTLSVKAIKDSDA